MREKLIKLIAEGHIKVILDFKGVTYIDSSGLATLIEMFQRFKKTNGSMVFVNMGDKINNLFEITKIDMFFSVYNSQEDALNSF